MIFNNTTASPQNVSAKIADDKPGTIILVFLGTYYIAVLLIGCLGNILIISAVVKYKHMKTVVNGFLLNLAFSDLLFTILTLFDALNFMYGEWQIGDIGCRLQSTLIEVSYTVSVLTLASVALERYMSICHPYRRKRKFKQSLYISSVIWLVAIIFCAALFHGYTTHTEYSNNNQDGKLKCENDNWSSKSRLAFYITHSVLIYLLPLTVLCVSHYKISKVLLHQQRYRSSTVRPVLNADKLRSSIRNNCSVKSKTRTKSERESKVQQTVNRRLKIIKLLVVITITFFILWTPFILTRLLMYFDVAIPELFWRGTQLFMFANTAINCIIYALMSPAFKAAFKGLLVCESTTNKSFWMNASISKSIDATEVIKKQSVLKASIDRVH